MFYLENPYMTILLMTTAPPSDAPWYLGKKLPPLGLSFVAGALEKAGFDVQVLDNYMLKKPLREVQELVKKLNPEIVGITCGSATFRRCVETSKAIKEVLPTCKIVVGGWHASYVPDSILEIPDIDYVVMGEGEQAMVELAASLTQKNGKPLEGIAGLGYKVNGQIVKNPPQFIKDLDQVPFPARHLLPMELYDRTIEFLSVKPADTMSIVRGCPFNCAFCETKKLWGNTCRTFSPNHVVDEIQYLQEKYNSKGIYFINDNFTIKKKVTEGICDEINRRNMDVRWACDTRPDLISQELLHKMHKAGCETIWFGVESGSPRMLERLNKRITLEQVTQAVKLCRKEHLQVACSFIMGIPDETVEDMEKSLQFAIKLDPDWCRFNIYVAYPDSVLYEEVKQKKLYDREEDFLLYVKTDNFDYESLTKIQMRFHMAFSRSPRRIIRKIRREGFFTTLKQSYKLIRPPKLEKYTGD
jgi:anaerobic magnesium-protoporphyrin IX monomethyl ester cyclase